MANHYKPIIEIFSIIAEAESELQNLRQLLNQEIQFNKISLFQYMVSKAKQNTSYITLFEITIIFFNDANVNVNSIENLIKFYSSNQLKLNQQEFSRIFITRQDKLLAKIVDERQQIFNIPKYIHSFIKKIILKEYCLHEKINSWKEKYSNVAQKWIQQIFNKKQQLQTIQVQLTSLFSTTQLSQDQNIKDSVQRYLKRGQQLVLKQSLLTLLTQRNSKMIRQYLNNLKQKKIRTKGLKNPLIANQFHNLTIDPIKTTIFNFREAKSIEKHCSRMNIFNSSTLNRNIKIFAESSQQDMKKFCEVIKKILKVENKTEQMRTKLFEATDINLRQFYENFPQDKEGQIIPSSIHHYLISIGIKIHLEQIYCLFKRYSLSTGKINFRTFCSIFQSPFLHFQNQPKVMDINSKKLILNVLKKSAQNQFKIDKIKQGLNKMKCMNLRDIFEFLDEDKDGLLNKVDFQIAFKRFLGQKLNENELNLFWWRMGYQRTNQKVKYQKFIFQMNPKKVILKQSK